MGANTRVPRLRMGFGDGVDGGGEEGLECSCFLERRTTWTLPLANGSSLTSSDSRVQIDQRREDGSENLPDDGVIGKVHSEEHDDSEIAGEEGEERREKMNERGDRCV